MFFEFLRIVLIAVVTVAFVWIIGSAPKIQTGGPQATPSMFKSKKR